MLADGKAAAPKVISVTSGKGGVGKTSLVVNLAAALAMRDQKVVILDADLGLANIDVVLGLAPKFNIKHVLAGQKRLEDVVVEGPHGIRIIPASSGLEELARLLPEQKLSLLAEFDRFKLDFDIMLVDTATGISSDVAYFNTAAQHILVVLFPEPASLTDAYALIKLLHNRYRQRDFRVVVNGARSEREAREIFNALANVCHRFLDLTVDWIGFVPKDEAFVRAIRQQRLVIDGYPDSPSARAIFALADEIIKLPIPALKGTYQFFWTRLLKLTDAGDALWNGKSGD